MERNTRVVKVSDLKIGGNNPIIIQSMTNTNSAEDKNKKSELQAKIVKKELNQKTL